MNLADLRVVLITDRRIMGDGSLVAFREAVATAVDALPTGTTLVQVREDDLDDVSLQPYVEAAMAAGAPVIVNDRLDVALVTGAAGVQLSVNGPLLSDVRRRSPEGFWVGLTKLVREVPPNRTRIEDVLRKSLRQARDTPNDIVNWFKIAHLYAMKGAAERALDAYLTVAEDYESRGLLTKSMAIYVRMLGIEPTRVETLRKLAELHSRLGLAANATPYSNLAQGIQLPHVAVNIPGADLIQLGPVFDEPSMGSGRGTRILSSERIALDNDVAYSAACVARDNAFPGIRSRRYVAASGPARLVAVGGIADASRALECRNAGADAVATIGTAWTDSVVGLA